MTRTPSRAVFETALLPAFAARFQPTDLVLNIGAGRHAYREYFPCRVVTADRNPDLGCDLACRAEQIPCADASVDGIVLMGVFERLDDPMQAMRELRRVLRPAGSLLLSAPDLGFKATKPYDRWRLSAGGAAHVVRDFRVLGRQHVANHAHFFLLEKAA